ncbi:MAG TPA: carboxypeptidase-like regulatory domain-containing protein [Bryobacteraceae bacterium]|nr:carboxypeptidase-like regulatory domain-containing protein [Bryobacteraceae bacterium]
MRNRCLGLLAVLLTSAFVLSAQVSSTSTLSGTVTDPTGATVPGASVAVQNSETGVVFRATTGSAGTFSVPSLGTGTYMVTVTAPGFKESRVANIKHDAAVPTAIEVRLEVGQQTESVTVEASAAILQTQTAAVNTTLTGRQIVELPLVSREALDLTLSLPNVETPGRPRTSTVDGLAKGAINITMDGVNVQDNQGKSTDGFYTYVRPRLDAVEEVTVSSGASGSDSTGEGAVQIKFVTRSGSNEPHGSLYEYHRDTALNANYWFNNRNLPPDPATGKAPKTRNLLNQPGGRFGGPVYIPKVFDGRNKLFFFVNYEEFRLPEEALRTRSVLSALGNQGIFQYNTSSGVRQVNLLTLAAANNQTSTMDPTTSALLNAIAATEVPGGLAATGDPNVLNDNFINKGGQLRKFITLRFDANLNSKNTLELSWNYQHLYYTGNKVDFFNFTDPEFPGFPNKGSIPSYRFDGVIAWRSTITSRMVNELRAGLQGGTIYFEPEVNAGQFANQQGFNLGLNAADSITTATSVPSPLRRNDPVKNVYDNLNVSRNTHTLTFGFSFTQINLWTNSQTVIPSITFGVDPTDPAAAMFTAGNFPGASATDLSNAAGIYSVLTGRVTAIGASANASESGGGYVYSGPVVLRAQQRETGFFAQDSWKVRPNLTLNAGLRWEVEFPFVAENNRFSLAGYNGLFGVSGPGNLFKPGTLAGQPTVYNLLPNGVATYNTRWKDFSPSLGLAWNLKGSSGPLAWLLGTGGTSVLRAGYSLAYDREAITSLTGAIQNNPGTSIDATRNMTAGNLVSGTGTDVLPLLLRQTSRLGPPNFASAPSYPIASSVNSSANAISPDLKMPYVQTWSLGFQRSLSKDTVLEVRYFGDHLARQWTTINLNEVNIVENNFLNEFKLAQANLQANIAAGRGNTFKYFGTGTGTSPLPITLAYFSAVPASLATDPTKYTSSLFSSSTYVNTLAANNPAPYTFISSMATNNATQRANAIAAGLPSNFFVVNPGVSSANLLTNLGGSTYNAGTVELRRRLSAGLLFDLNYTYSKGMTSLFLSNRAPLTKALSPLNITQAFKMNWIYELPFGQGKALLGNAHGVLGKIVSGWSINGTGRVQSGDPVNLGNVRLVGMTRGELQAASGMNFNDGLKIAYYLPQDIIQNTIRAFNVSATSATGYGTLGAPSGRYIAPANGPGCIEVYAGQCGGTSIVMYGPHFTRFDISAAKKTKLTERVTLEIRGELLNAFNNINFIVGSPNSDTNSITNFSSQSFGQVTNAYQDLSTTYDPGGRLIQFVGRINF